MIPGIHNLAYRRFNKVREESKNNNIISLDLNDARVFMSASDLEIYNDHEDSHIDFASQDSDGKIICIKSLNMF